MILKIKQAGNVFDEFIKGKKDSLDFNYGGMVKKLSRGGLSTDRKKQGKQKQLKSF